jgi:hypothetical protein
MLSEIQDQLHPSCVALQKDRRAFVGAFWRAWSFVDLVHRLRELAQALPGLSRRNSNLKTFLAATQLAEVYRHYIQHLRSQLSKPDLDPFPVWGSLSWVDGEDSTFSHMILAGATVGKTSYSGCVFDTVQGQWVSKVCLGIEGYSFNFDPIFAACEEFVRFVVPWILETYKPELKVVDEPPVVTIGIVPGPLVSGYKSNSVNCLREASSSIGSCVAVSS